MKKLFGRGLWLALLPAAQAHESWPPHTHVIDRQYSDLFVLCAVGLVALMAGLLLFRRFGNRRGLKKSSRGPGRGS